MTEAIAGRIYAVLLQSGWPGAKSENRGQFVAAMMRPGGCPRYHFGGALGDGGSFHVERNRWCVSTYPEYWTDERLILIARVNQQLEPLYAEFYRRA